MCIKNFSDLITRKKTLLVEVIIHLLIHFRKGIIHYFLIMKKNLFYNYINVKGYNIYSIINLFISIFFRKSINVISRRYPCLGYDV
jgi:hypothetical protein